MGSVRTETADDDNRSLSLASNSSLQCFWGAAAGQSPAEWATANMHRGSQLARQTYTAELRTQ